MKLLNLNKKLSLSLFLFIFFSSVYSEESVDIWKKENLKNTNKPTDIITEKTESKININLERPQEVDINSNILDVSSNLVYGIFDPEENNLTINMWVNSEGTRVKDTIERINKIKLSDFSEEIFINTLFNDVILSYI